MRPTLYVVVHRRTQEAMTWEGALIVDSYDNIDEYPVFEADPVWADSSSVPSISLDQWVND